MRGPGHCVECHAAPDTVDDAMAPLSGGRAFELPVGRFSVPNITPDDETGIGRRSDPELARILRYGVRHDGRAALPFMSFAHVSDEDLVAVISYLRSQPPVHYRVPEASPNVLGRMVLAYVLEPVAPADAVPTIAPVGATVERGRYLVHSLAGCVGCHTKIDHRTGERVGPELAGGEEMEVGEGPVWRFVPPSLQPDARTRAVTGRDEDAFVARFAAASGPSGSPMPWNAVGRMTEDDVRAIYRYLRTLPSSGEL